MGKTNQAFVLNPRFGAFSVRWSEVRPPHQRALVLLFCIFDAFRMLDLIKNPVLTEKSVRLIETHNQYMFDVDPRLTKPQIRELVQSLFGVRVLAVNTHCPPRKTRRMGATTGAKPRVKRAIVCVAKDQKIRLLPSLDTWLSSRPFWFSRGRFPHGKRGNGWGCLCIFPESFFCFFMGLRSFRPSTPGSRQKVLVTFEEGKASQPEKSLVRGISRRTGRNHRGVITVRHRGGGHKRLYRDIDFLRDKVGVTARVVSLQYDPNRNARLALLQYQDGEKRYILAPKGLLPGAEVMAGFRVPIEIGNALPLWNIPLGTSVHNIELRPGMGGQMARAAGAMAQLIAREQGYATLRLPSGEVRLVPQTCWATIGQVGNVDARNVNLGKAGRTRWLGRRPHVRGSVMNPVDHPHGGGEGRCPIGRSRPVTPWGKPTLGVKTRRPKKYSNQLILRRRSLSFFFFAFFYGSFVEKRPLCGRSFASQN